MRSMESCKNPILDTSSRLSALSIVVDDFDMSKGTNKENKIAHDVPKLLPSQQKPYTRQSSDASIKKILEEAEQRRHDFWKLLDEHTAVIENIKKIEMESSSVCKLTRPTIRSS